MHIEANALNQTATVHYDPMKTSLPDLERFVQECGYHCAGRSVPGHVCDPMEDPASHEAHAPSAERAADAHTGQGTVEWDVRDMQGG